MNALAEIVRLFEAIATNVRTIRNIIVAWTILTVLGAIFLVSSMAEAQRDTRLDKIVDCVAAGSAFETCERVID